MKSLSAQRLTAIANESRTDAGFARLELRNGTIIGMTNHVEDVVMGGLTYRTGTGYTPTASKSTDDLRPGTIDVEGILEVLGVDRGQIIDGVFDYARVYVFITDYTNPVEDEHDFAAGEWGRVTLQEGRFITEFRSLAEFVGQSIGRTYTAQCDAKLGDTRCGVVLEPADWAATTAYAVGDVVQPTTANGAYFECTIAGTSDSSEPTWDFTIGNTTVDATVTWLAIKPYTQPGFVVSVVDNQNFTDTGLTQDSDWWAYGKVIWLTGDNAGLEMEVKSFSSGAIQLFLPMTNEVQVADTFTIQVGCRKRFDEDCIAKFDNAVNFQGFPHVPLQDASSKFGGQ